MNVKTFFNQNKTAKQVEYYTAIGIKNFIIAVSLVNILKKIGY